MNTRPFNYDEYLAGAKVQTRDGEPVEQVAFLRDLGAQPIMYSRRGQLIRLHEDGRYWDNKQEEAFDLVLVSDTVFIGDTVLIGGVEVPAPMRKAPRKETYYWLLDLADDTIKEWEWRDDQADRYWLEHRCVFSTKADAKAFREAFYAL